VSRIVYVNGRYLPYAKAAVHVEDRGFQFADSIYEVCQVRSGRLVDETRHMARLARSLAELKIPAPMSAGALAHVMRETVRRNRVTDGLVYLQVTRGEGPRDFVFPSGDVPRTVVCLARSIPPGPQAALAETGIAVKTVPDIRWRRSDIKTVMLLPACLAKEAARAEGAREAWFVDNDGFVTEGASSNAWIVSSEGAVITRQIAPVILAGVTRATLMDQLREERVEFVERPFRLEEALQAREAFITSATNTVMPVVRIDGTKIGDGRPGPVTRRLRSKFDQYAAISGA
jgi:D-alanine transaminase